MKSFFIDLFDYHHQTNQRLADQLIEHKKQLTSRSIPLFSHAINAHQIWNARILDQKPLGVFDVHSLPACKILDEHNYKASNRILETVDLKSSLPYTNSKGETFQNTIRDILFHATNHLTHHRGQLISDLREQGIAPIVTDYIFYKR